jgi:aristolochene synthase
MHDLWEDVKACDAVLREQIMESVFTFMRAQKDKIRLAIHQLGEYLEYREKDVGQAYVLYIFLTRVVFKLNMLLN